MRQLTRSMALQHRRDGKHLLAEEAGTQPPFIAAALGFLHTKQERAQIHDRHRHPPSCTVAHVMNMHVEMTHGKRLLSDQHTAWEQEKPLLGVWSEQLQSSGAEA